MTAAQAGILDRLRAALGDEAAERVLRGWRQAGVDRERDERLDAAELRRMIAWRFDPNPHRRRIAHARLARHGYSVELVRTDPRP